MHSTKQYLKNISRSYFSKTVLRGTSGKLVSGNLSNS